MGSWWWAPLLSLLHQKGWKALKMINKPYGWCFWSLKGPILRVTEATKEINNTPLLPFFSYRSCSGVSVLAASAHQCSVAGKKITSARSLTFLPCTASILSYSWHQKLDLGFGWGYSKTRYMLSHLWALVVFLFGWHGNYARMKGGLLTFEVPHLLFLLPASQGL